MLTVTPESGLLSRALVWLAAHPDTDAKTIANAMGVRDDRLMYALLRQAERAGVCQRWRQGKNGWLWQAL